MSRNKSVGAQITPAVERAARAICSFYHDPDEFEPGNAPYDTDEEVVDAVLENGDPAHYNWRRYVGQALAALKAAGELPRSRAGASR